ncbi:hypothetical protein AC244_28755 [Ensifer adhaerens]|uniref:Uncharacterized protein n=1 Tax=Ensifer adhaerens TaxID=106592 RepID=A0A0L8BHM5_ENSAD|nr:hypothetical protein AC244_28755 [Ensifer adhaerens]
MFTSCIGCYPKLPSQSGRKRVADRRLRNSHLADVAAVQGHDFKGKAAVDDSLAGARKVTEPPQDEPGKRRIAIGLVDKIDIQQL